MLKVTARLSIPDEDMQLEAVRSQGAGGQNVNKVASAIHLRFDIGSSSLPQALKNRLRALPDRRISAEGVIVIKAQRFRSREQNADDARERLRLLVLGALHEPRRRIATRPTAASRERRIKSKTAHGRLKRLRTPVRGEAGD